MAKRKNDKRGIIRVYNTYMFRNKDPIIDKMRTMVQDNPGITQREACERSGVSVNAVNGWFNGKTQRPQFATCMAFCRAYGMDLVLTRGRNT